jgi:hypothetical protein
MKAHHIHGLRLSEAGYQYLMQRRAEREAGPDLGLDIFAAPGGVEIDDGEAGLWLDERLAG